MTAYRYGLLLSIVLLPLAFMVFVSGCDTESPIAEEAAPSDESERAVVEERINKLQALASSGGGGFFALPQEPSLSDAEMDRLRERLANDDRVVAGLKEINAWVRQRYLSLSEEELQEQRNYAREFLQKYDPFDQEMQISEEDQEKLRRYSGSEAFLNAPAFEGFGNYMVDTYPEVKELTSKQFATLFSKAIRKLPRAEYKDPNPPPDAGYPGDLLSEPDPSQMSNGLVGRGCDRDGKLADYNFCYKDARDDAITHASAWFAVLKPVSSVCLAAPGGPIAIGACAAGAGAAIGGAWLIALIDFHDRVKDDCQRNYGDHGCHCKVENSFLRGIGCELRNPSEGLNDENDPVGDDGNNAARYLGWRTPVRWPVRGLAPTYFSYPQPRPRPSGGGGIPEGDVYVDLIVIGIVDPGGSACGREECEN